MDQNKLIQRLMGTFLEELEMLQRPNVVLVGMETHFCVMQTAFDAHKAALDRREETFFTEHAAENETEFFADATEAFFCRPHDLREEGPGVYELLAAYYRVDPTRWFPDDG